MSLEMKVRGQRAEGTSCPQGQVQSEPCGDAVLGRRAPKLAVAGNPKSLDVLHSEIFETVES